MQKTKRLAPPRDPGLPGRLKKARIRHFDELIHDQKKEWLIRSFRAGGRNPPYPINVARLMRNLVWQMKERIAGGEKPPLDELVRTYWYMYVKPTLARADSLAEETDQYKQLTAEIVDMVKKWKVMEYKDIRFRDENQAHRSVGLHANIIPVAEKIGHHPFLVDLRDKYNVSIIALGGQPSVMNVEYFVDDIKEAGTNLQRSFYLYSLVDYDASGWIIRDAFLGNFSHYKIKNVRTFDLINPDMLTKDEILMARYPVKAGKDMEAKNRKWLRQVRSKHYKNQQYLEEEQRGGKLKLYGLEAESISTKRLLDKLKEVMVPRIGRDEDLLKLFEMKNLNQAVKELIIFKLTHPEVLS